MIEMAHVGRAPTQWAHLLMIQFAHTQLGPGTFSPSPSPLPFVFLAPRSIHFHCVRSSPALCSGVEFMRALISSATALCACLWRREESIEIILRSQVDTRAHLGD